MNYDNTKATRLDAIRTWLGASTHYHINTPDFDFAFCFIRKNACSALKDFFVAQSAYSHKFAKCRSTKQFVDKYHKIKTPRALSKVNNTIFVYRDPFDRAASLFRNKFIMKRGPRDLFPNYRKVTGRDPNNATFDDFVLLYLAQNMRRLNQHCHPQYRHLLPINYTHAIPMHDLKAGMATIVGAELADKHFSKRANSSSLGGHYDSPAYDVPVDEANVEWQKSGQLPSVKSLLTEQTRTTLERIYDEDFRMLSEITTR